MRAAVVALFAVACGGAPAAGTATPSARDAGWSRVQDHLDRFDNARFQPDPAARQSLLAELSVTGDPANRARTTDAAIDALLVEVDRVLAADRLHAGAQAARTMLELDRHPPTDRKQLLAATRSLKAIARGGGPLAPNATLRLAAMCDRAFRDAPAASAPRRPGILTTCLYPLYDADPEPYFEPDPARRPPPPVWTDLDARLGELLAPLASTRLAAAARRLHPPVDPSHLPRSLDPRALGVPLVVDPQAAEPYDWQPLVIVRDPTPEELAKFEAELRGMLDGGGRVALAVRADAPARQLLTVAALARRLGADRADLVVGYEQVVRAPPGDYWHDREPSGRVPRAGVLPLALDPASLGPRAALGLRLIVAPRSWQLVSAKGSMPAIAIGEDPAPARAELRAQLAQLLDAFPDEGALSIAPDPEATIGALASAIHTISGVTVALDPRPAKPGGGDLAARAARRAAARVTLQPEALAPKAPAVRRCWQDAVERKVAAGTLALELAGKTVKPISGPADEALRRCVAARLGEAMVSGGITSARVGLEVR